VFHRAEKAPPGLDGRLAAVARAGSQALGVAHGAGLDVAGRRVRVVVDATSLATARASVAAAGGSTEATYANLLESFVPPPAGRPARHRGRADRARNGSRGAALPVLRRVGGRAG